MHYDGLCIEDIDKIYSKTTPKLGILTRNVFLYLHIFGFGEYKLNDKMEDTYQLSLEWMLQQFYCPLVRVRRLLQHFCPFEGTTSKMIIRRNSIEYVGHINFIRNFIIFIYYLYLPPYATLDGRNLTRKLWSTIMQRITIASTIHSPNYPSRSTESLHFLLSMIYLAREQIDKWDVTKWRW